ncbi:unnamed protein product [Ixodes hexagonus]
MGKFYRWTWDNFGSARYQQQPFRERDFDKQEALFEASRNTSSGHQPGGSRPFPQVTLPTDVRRPILRQPLLTFDKNRVGPRPVARWPQYPVPQAPKFPSSQATTNPIVITPGPSTAVQALLGNNEAAKVPQYPNNGTPENLHLKVPLVPEKLPLLCDTSMPRKVPSKVQSTASLLSKVQMPPSLPAKTRVPVDLPSKSKTSVLRSRTSRPNGTTSVPSALAQPPAKPVASHETAKQVPALEVRERSKKVCRCKRTRVLRDLAVDDLVEDVSDVSLEEYCEDGLVPVAKRCKNKCSKAKRRMSKAVSGVKRKLPHLDDMEDVSDTPLEENGSRSLLSDSTKAKSETQDNPKKAQTVDTVLPEPEEPLPPVIEEPSSNPRISSNLAHPGTSADMQAQGDCVSDSTKDVAQQGAHKFDARFQEVEDVDDSMDLKLPNITGLEQLGSADTTSHETDRVSSQHKDVLVKTQAREISASGAPEKAVKVSEKLSAGIPHIKALSGAKNPEQRNVRPEGCTSNIKKTSPQGKIKKNAESPRMKRRPDLNGTRSADITQESCVPSKTKVVPKKTTKTIPKPTGVKCTDDPKDSAFIITKVLKPTEKSNVGLSKIAVTDDLKHADSRMQGSGANDVKQRTSEGKMKDAAAKQPLVRDIQNKVKLKSKQIQGSMTTDAKEIAARKRTEKSNMSSKAETALSLKSKRSPSAAPVHEDRAAVLALQTMHPNRMSDDAKCADSSKNLVLTGSVEAGGHHGSDVVSTTLSRKDEEDPGLSKLKPGKVKDSSISRKSASGGMPTTVLKTARKRNASLSEANGSHVTGSKHVQKGRTSPNVKTLSPINPKKRRASASETEDLQGPVHAIRPGSAEIQAKHPKKRKRSASLSEVNKAHIYSVSSQSMSTVQAKQLTRSDASFHGIGGKSAVKQAEFFSKKNEKLPEVNKAHGPEHLKCVASVPSQKTCGIQAKQPTQPGAVDINANEVEVQSASDVEGKLPVDTTPTGKEYTPDTLKTAPSEPESETTTAYEHQDTLDLEDVKHDQQLHDAMTDPEDVKPCYVQHQETMLGPDDVKPCDLQPLNAMLDSKDLKHSGLELHDKLVIKEEKPPSLQLESVKMKSNKKVKKKSSSGTNTSMRSVWCFPRRKKTKKVVKSTDDVGCSIAVICDIKLEASAMPKMTDDGPNFTEVSRDDPHQETMQCDDSTTEDSIWEPVNILGTKLCSSATDEAIAQCPSRVEDRKDDCDEAAATIEGESRGAVSGKESVPRNLAQKGATTDLVHASPKDVTVELRPRTPVVTLQCKDSATPLQPKDAAVELQPKAPAAALQCKDSAMPLPPKDIADTSSGSPGAQQGKATSTSLLRSSLLDLDLATGLSILDVCQTDSSKQKEFQERAMGDKLSKQGAMHDIAKAVHDAIVEEYFKRERAVRALKLLAKIPFSKEHDAVVRTRQLIHAVVTNAADNSKAAP